MKKKLMEWIWSNAWLSIDGVEAHPLFTLHSYSLFHLYREEGESIKWVPIKHPRLHRLSSSPSSSSSSSSTSSLSSWDKKAASRTEGSTLLNRCSPRVKETWQEHPSTLPSPLLHRFVLFLLSSSSISTSLLFLSVLERRGIITHR